MPDKPLASQGARSRDNRERPANSRVSITRPAFARYRVVRDRTDRPPTALARGSAQARKRADLTHAIESGGLRVLHATALPRAGERARFESQNALGLPPEDDRLGCAGEGVRGDRAAFGARAAPARGRESSTTSSSEPWMGRGPASSLAKGALKVVQAVPVSYPAPPPRPRPSAPENHPFARSWGARLRRYLGPARVTERRRVLRVRVA